MMNSVQTPELTTVPVFPPHHPHHPGLSPTVLDLPALSSEQLYRFELAHLPPRATGREEHAIVAQARAGHLQARSRLIEDGMRYVMKFANQFAHAYRRDVLDLVAQGNFILTESLDEALASDCPPAYLRTKVYYGSITYCNATHTLITTPRYNGQGEKPKPLFVASLERPINEDGDLFFADTLADSSSAHQGHPAKDEADYTALYTAIDTVLSKREREVILRYYGLRGYAQQNLFDISEAWYGERRGSNGKRRKSSAVDQAKANALNKLRSAFARPSSVSLSMCQEAEKKK